MKQQFESFVKAELGDVAVEDGGRYISQKINNYWRCWQEARRSAIEAAEKQEPVAWQPIETAPKGSVAILVWCPKRMNIYAAYTYKSDWCAFGGGVLSETPTHWMPMPAAPGSTPPTAPVQEPTDWESVAADQAMTIAMMKVDQERSESAYQRGYLDGIGRQCPQCADYRAMYLKVRDELAAEQQREIQRLKPLTDEQISAMCKHAWVFETAKQWVRAIEAAHENMDAMCELRTEIARLTNENARLKAQPAPVQEPVALPMHETEEMHDAVMNVIYQGVTRGNTDALWQAYRKVLVTTPPNVATPLAAQPAPVQDLPFGVGGGLVAIKTLLSRDPCVHANTAIEMIDAILNTPPAQPAPDLSGLRPATQEAIKRWLADGTFVERAIGAMEAQERENMRLEKLVAAQPAPSQYGSPELQAMIVARAIEKDRAAQPVPVQGPHPTVYVYRLENGGTQVMAPTINDPALVTDMLEQALVAMSDEGHPITRN